MALCPGIPGWAGTRKVRPIWILLKQETASGSGIHWAICKSAPRSRQITMPAPHRSVFHRPDALPATQPTVSGHWRQFVTTGGNSSLTQCRVLTGMSRMVSRTVSNVPACSRVTRARCEIVGIAVSNVTSTLGLCPFSSSVHTPYAHTYVYIQKNIIHTQLGCVALKMFTSLPYIFQYYRENTQHTITSLNFKFSDSLHEVRFLHCVINLWLTITACIAYTKSIMFTSICSKTWAKTIKIRMFRVLINMNGQLG